VKRWVTLDEIAACRYANRFTLSASRKTSKCKQHREILHILQKTDYKRDECWSLNGRSKKEQPRRTKRDVEKGKQVNITVKVRKNKLLARREEAP